MNYTLHPRATLFLVLALFFGFSACEKETFTPENEPAAVLPVNTAKDYMVFENTKAFMDMLSKPVEEIRTVQAEKFAGTSFTSYSQHFAAIEEELARLEALEQLPKSVGDIEKQFGVRIEDDSQGGKIVVPAVQSLRLAAITNENGVYQLGDALVQITYDQYYVAKVVDVVDFTDLSTTPGVRTEALYANTPDKVRFVTHECVENYFHNGQEHRIKSEWGVEYNDFPAPNGGTVTGVAIDVRIKHQKRGIFGIWFANSEQRIWSDGGITHLDQIGPGVTITNFFSIDHESFNSSSLNIDIFGGEMVTDIPAEDWIISPSWALHSSRDVGTYINCFIEN